MFWKYDDEEKKVVPRKEEKKTLTPSEFVQKAHEAKHASFLHSLDEEDQELIFKALEEKKDAFGSSDESGSEKRFEDRIVSFKKENQPVFKHHIWWLIHNCVAHPLIGVIPSKITFDFHDWTSKKINGV